MDIKVIRCTKEKGIEIYADWIIRIGYGLCGAGAPIVGLNCLHLYCIFYELDVKGFSFGARDCTP